MSNKSSQFQCFSCVGEGRCLPQYSLWPSYSTSTFPCYSHNTFTYTGIIFITFDCQFGKKNNNSITISSLHVFEWHIFIRISSLQCGISTKVFPISWYQYMERSFVCVISSIEKTAAWQQDVQQKFFVAQKTATSVFEPEKVDNSSPPFSLHSFSFSIHFFLYLRECNQNHQIQEEICRKRNKYWTK